MGQDVGQGEGTDKESCLVPPPFFFATRAPNRQLLLMLSFPLYLWPRLLSHGWRVSFKLALIILH